MTSTTDEFPGGYPPTPQEEKNEELDASQKEKSEGGSLLQYSKDLVSSVMPGKEKSEENKETATSPQEKGGHEGSITQPQEKSEGSLLQYSKDFVSSVMPGKEKSEENKGTPTSPRGEGEENKESVTQPQEKSEGSLLQYSKDFVSSVIPGKEKNEENKGTPTSPQEKSVENKGPDNSNNVAKVSTHGSSALGGITNPLNLLLGDESSPKRDDADSPVHPAFKGEVDTSHTIKPHNVAAGQKGQKSSDVVLPNAILPESRLLPKDDVHQSGSQQTFDLTGDYNKQKEREQEQDRRDQKLPEKHHQKQEEVSPKDKYAYPHSPPLKVPVGNNNERPGKVEVIPPKPSSAVHPDDQDVIPKITKKDRVNATVGKAVGILKEKIGKLVKNDNLAAKGAEKKADAKRTKELAEVQKRVDDI